MMKIARKLADEDRFCTHCGLEFTRAAQFIDTCFSCENAGHNPKNGAICGLCNPNGAFGSESASEGLKTPGIGYI